MASLRSAAALVFALFVAREAVAGPAYIEANPRELAEAYGQEVADRAFSDEFTALRKTRIDESLARVPGLKCPSSASFVLRDLYPFGAGPGDVVWIERYEVQCGKPLRRALVMVLKENRIEAAPMAPGATLTDPQLQIEAGRLVSLTGLARGPKACGQAPVIDTAVTEKPTAVGIPWKERWTVNACGEILEVDLIFEPSPVGGTMIRVPGQ